MSVISDTRVFSRVLVHPAVARVKSYFWKWDCIVFFLCCPSCGLAFRHNGLGLGRAGCMTSRAGGRRRGGGGVTVCRCRLFHISFVISKSNLGALVNPSLASSDDSHVCCLMQSAWPCRADFIPSSVFLNTTCRVRIDTAGSTRGCPVRTFTPLLTERLCRCPFFHFRPRSDKITEGGFGRDKWSSRHLHFR